MSKRQAHFFQLPAQQSRRNSQIAIACYARRRLGGHPPFRAVVRFSACCCSTKRSARHRQSSCDDSLYSRPHSFSSHLSSGRPKLGLAEEAGAAMHTVRSAARGATYRRDRSMRDADSLGSIVRTPSEMPTIPPSMALTIPRQASFRSFYNCDWRAMRFVTSTEPGYRTSDGRRRRACVHASAASYWSRTQRSTNSLAGSLVSFAWSSSRATISDWRASGKKPLRCFCSLALMSGLASSRRRAWPTG